MKVWIFAGFAALLLFFLGWVLLNSSQSPMGGLAPAPLPAAEIAQAPAPMAMNQLPIVSQEPPANVDLATDKFRLMVAEIRESLPTKAYLMVIKNDDISNAPAPVVKAGDDLARIAHAVHENAELSAPAQVFLKECAGGGQYPDSVRALCLHYFRRLARKNGRSTPEGFAPPFIRSFADKLGT